MEKIKEHVGLRKGDDGTLQEWTYQVDIDDNKKTKQVESGGEASSSGGSTDGNKITIMVGFCSDIKTNRKIEDETSSELTGRYDLSKENFVKFGTLVEEDKELKDWLGGWWCIDDVAVGTLKFCKLNTYMHTYTDRTLVHTVLNDMVRKNPANPPGPFPN